MASGLTWKAKLLLAPNKRPDCENVMNVMQFESGCPLFLQVDYQELSCSPKTALFRQPQKVALQLDQ